MVNYLTRLRVADNSGARLVQCIKILAGSFCNQGGAGNLLVVVVKRIDPAKEKITKGLIFRGVIVRCCNSFIRGCGVWVRFNQNAIVLINKRNAPFAKRLKGPMIKEICIRFNFIGTVTRFLV